MDSLQASRLIDYNPRYHYIAPNTKIVLASTAESVSYNTANGSGISEINLTFTLEPEGNFLDRAVTLKIPKIPLNFTRTAAIGGTAGAKTLADFFGGYDSICMRQYGLLNAINSCKLSIDGKLHHTCTQSGKMLNITSQFYEKDGVHRWFQASQPDIFPKYSLYSSSAAVLDVVAENGTKISMRKPIYGNGGIFAEMSDDYSSRIPIFSTDTALTEATSTANVVLHDQKCLIPFNLFGIPQDETPLYNAKRITVTITLSGDWWRQIFSIKTVGTTEIADIKFRRDKLTEFLPHLSYTVRTGQQDSLSLVNRPFAVETALVELSSNLQNYPVKGHAKQQVKPIKFDLSCIPKRSYIYVKALYSVADAAHVLKEARTADLYGRIDSLKIKIGNKETTIAIDEASVTYDLAKQHGLNRSFEQSMYLNGYAVPIDFSETVGLEPGVLVGTSGSRNGGTPVMWVSLSFTNLSDEEMMYEVGCIHAYQGMMASENGSWNIKSAFESTYDSNSGLQDLEQQLMTQYNYIGGRSGGGIGTFFSQYLPKIGNGLKNLVTAAFTDPKFRSTIADAWKGSSATSTTGGASFDDHAPLMGGFYQHSNNFNERGGNNVQQWSTR